MNHAFALLLLAGTCALSACGDSISTNDQPVTGNHPAPADTVTGLDTLAAPAGGAPFVNPAGARRGHGIRHPSPPATRSH